MQFTGTGTRAGLSAAAKQHIRRRVTTPPPPHRRRFYLNAHVQSAATRTCTVPVIVPSHFYPGEMHT
jgi:hypothetical protein